MINTEIRMIIVFAAKDGEVLHNQQKQDWELTVAQNMISLLQNSNLRWKKKVGKTIRPFRYDLNQIPHNYTVEAINMFKGLDLIEYLKNYRWRFVQEAVIKTIHKKKKCKKGKMVSEDTLQIAENRREAKGKGEKKGYTHLNVEF